MFAAVKNAVLPGKNPYLATLGGLAVPVMLENLSQIFLGTVDTYFAGRIGDDAIAAINVTNMFMNLFVTVFTAFGVGVLVMISSALGEGDEAKANRLVRQAVLLGLGGGAGFGLLNFFCRRPFLMLAGAEGEILRLGLTYYLAVCVPCVFLCLTLILAAGLKAARNTRASMRAALAANLFNALFDALFVSLGLGVLGLGLATTLARAFNLALLVRLYRKKVTPLRLDRRGWRPEPAALKALAGYSGPIMLTQLSARFAILIHGSLILHLGAVYYTANSIATQLDEYACIPSAGFEAATAAMVSGSLGAGNPRDASRYTRTAFFATALAMTAAGAVLALFALPLTGLFTQTGQIRQMVAQVLTFMVLFNWTSALSHILTSAVQGTGDSRYPLWVTLAGNILMRLGAGYLLAYWLDWGLIGIWSGIVLDFLLRGTLLGRRFIRQYRA